LLNLANIDAAQVISKAAGFLRTHGELQEPVRYLKLG
jgi:hypothetical protein